jgi:hypothetical protein
MLVPIRVRRRLRATAVILGFALSPLLLPPPVARAQVASVDKGARLRKLQKLNRVFQVCYGRSLKAKESKQVLPLTEPQLVQRILNGEELTKVYAKRLVDFAGGSANVVTRTVDARVRGLARPGDKLDIVLAALDRGHHKGASCGDKSNAVCFATWLVTGVAPSLGYDWVKAREADLPNWTYAKLLEEISRSSISQ